MNALIYENEVTWLQTPKRINYDQQQKAHISTNLIITDNGINVLSTNTSSLGVNPVSKLFYLLLIS